MVHARTSSKGPGIGKLTRGSLPSRLGGVSVACVVDARCPIEQAEQLFVALRRYGKRGELVRFEREGHEMVRRGKPVLRVERLERILIWLKSHLQA